MIPEMPFVANLQTRLKNGIPQIICRVTQRCSLSRVSKICRKSPSGDVN